MTVSNTSGNIIWPRVPFIDQTSGQPALPWLLWLQSPNFVSVKTGTQSIQGNQIVAGDETIGGNALIQGSLTALGGISGGTF
jgi:hypothetical protein